MSGKTHSIIGVAITLVFLILPSVVGLLPTKPVMWLCILGAFVGSLMVDIDSKKSKAAQLYTKVAFFLLVVYVIFNIAGTYAFKSLPSSAEVFKNIMLSENGLKLLPFIIVVFLGKVSPHRQFTHKILGTTLMIGTAYFGFKYDFTVGFAIGYLAHILADKTTKAGVKFFDLKLPMRTASGSYSFHF